MKKDYQIVTEKGYDFFEVSSSLQKSIRRCDEDSAMYWAVELINSGYENYLWKRTLIMVSEDVGLGNDQLPVQLNALYQNYLMLSKNKAREKYLPLVHAIMLLVRSPKSRVVDWANGKYFGEHYHVDLDIPDYALDKHTKRGKIMGRTINHFFDEGAKLENQAKVDREEEYLDWCKAHWNNDYAKESESLKLNAQNKKQKQQTLL